MLARSLKAISVTNSSSLNAFLTLASPYGSDFMLPKAGCNAMMMVHLRFVLFF